MERGATESEDRQLYLNEENLIGPIRILVQTKTSLVPGEGYHERCMFMLNTICQHHWNRDFDLAQDRWNVYGAQFGYDNRDCYFLIDHGQSLSDKDSEYNGTQVQTWLLD